MSALILLSLSLFLAAAGIPQSPIETPNEPCGEVVDVAAHSRQTTRYAFLAPDQSILSPKSLITRVAAPREPGSCQSRQTGRALAGNFLVRSIPIFVAAGFGIALVDAPSGYQGEGGSRGFQTAAEPAADLGQVIADVRLAPKGRSGLSERAGD